jgi:inositol-phosphate phosphatase/L-galactose 1-phosphate phosphatase/histidinol-phosphatase
MTDRCPDPFVTLAGDLADAAREVTLKYFRADLEVDTKSDATPVTQADRETEARLRKMIRETFPDHGIIGEEEGPERPGASHIWVLDPIDGTKKFITGNPLFGTLIALLRDGRPILGVIDTPAEAERWLGATGHGAHHRHRGKSERAVCRACPNIGAAALYTTSPQMFEGSDAKAFERLRRAAHFPIYGGECYAYGLLASGYADLVIEGDMAIYDYLSHVPIVTEAGGVMTDWEGAPLGLDSGGLVIAAGDPACHARALALLRGEKPD